MFRGTKPLRGQVRIDRCDYSGVYIDACPSRNTFTSRETPTPKLEKSVHTESATKKKRQGNMKAPQVPKSGQYRFINTHLCPKEVSTPPSGRTSPSPYIFKKSHTKWYRADASSPKTDASVDPRPGCISTSLHTRSSSL